MISIHRQNIWLSTLWRRNMLLIHQLLILRFQIFKRHIPLFHFSKERLIWGRYLFKILRVSNDLSYFPMCRSRTSFFIFRNIFVIPAFQDHFLQRHGQNILQYQYIAISISIYCNINIISYRDTAKTYCRANRPIFLTLRLWCSSPVCPPLR